MGWWKICQAQNAIAVVVKLKDPHLFPYKKKYPLKPEVKEGLKHIIETLKEQELLIPCNILWTPEVKNQLIRKDPEAGKD